MHTHPSPLGGGGGGGGGVGSTYVCIQGSSLDGRSQYQGIHGYSNMGGVCNYASLGSVRDGSSYQGIHGYSDKGGGGALSEYIYMDSLVTMAIPG